MRGGLGVEVGPLTTPRRGLKPPATLRASRREVEGGAAERRMIGADADTLA
jgi:hypothetical protein